MFTAVSCFQVQSSFTDDVRQAFESRPHLVENAAGFISLQVLSPLEDPSEFWLITNWQDEESFREWHTSHLYRESHASIPKGIKLVKGSAKLRLFDFITS